MISLFGFFLPLEAYVPFAIGEPKCYVALLCYISFHILVQ